MDYYKQSLELHKQHQGKIELGVKVPLTNADDLSCAYTPGVAQPCLEIAHDAAAAYDYTCKANTVAVVSDGTAVLGLGNIGPHAAIPVMEGKAALFKKFGNVDAFPICLDTTEPAAIVAAIKAIAPVFGGINLEDISAPRCFQIEEILDRELDIPVFHDDQHGTAIVVLAALMNAARVVGKNLSDLRVVINGSGAAGTAILKMLRIAGVTRIVICDSKGVICAGRTGADGKSNLTAHKMSLCEISNPDGLSGSVGDALAWGGVGADVLIGVSGPDTVTREMVASMAAGAIVFALANPTPEIMPEDARAAGAAVVGSGRSDYPNQINNVLVFPGIFRGALDVHATSITPEMKLAAAHAIADLVSGDERCADYIIPSPFDERVPAAVAAAVAGAYKS